MMRGVATKHIMLNVIMPSAIRLSVVMLNVIMLSIVILVAIILCVIMLSVASPERETINKEMQIEITNAQLCLSVYPWGTLFKMRFNR
jgi:hypothetical protein